jgi:YbgC/YbaW family acyl-CoA thioester hydrolase
MQRTVKFQDVDAAGTVFYPRVLEYFADVYMEALRVSGLDVPRMLREKTMAAPLAHAEADFMRPMFFGDEVDVEVVALEVGKTSASFGYRIRKGHEVAAVGQTVHVFVDGQAFKPIDAPAELRAWAEKW